MRSVLVHSFSFCLYFFLPHFPMNMFTRSLLVLSLISLAACSASQAPLTEEEQAARYGMTLQEYRQEKEAAARMGMNWEEHIKMIQMNSGSMNMEHN